MRTKVVSKPLQHPICPNCGKYGKIEVERRPDGNAKCYDCGFKGKLTNFKRPEIKETTSIDIIEKVEKKKMVLELLSKSQSMCPMYTITTKSIDEETTLIDIQSMYPMSTITTKSIDEDTHISKRIANMRLNKYVK